MEAKLSPIPNSPEKRAGCSHSNLSDIGYVLDLNGRCYDAFCNICNARVYARTGKVVIRWNTERNLTFAS